MAKLTEVIIGCAMKVHRTLGPGYLEKVYENAMMIELRKAGLFAEQQKPVSVHYFEEIVGDYVADILVEHKVLIELKTVKGLIDEFTNVCLNHLKSTRCPVCLLINFAKPSLEWKRFVGESYDESRPI